MPIKKSSKDDRKKGITSSKKGVKRLKLSQGRYDEEMQDRIWYYILMKYFYNAMMSSKTNIQSGDQKIERKDISKNLSKVKLNSANTYSKNMTDFDPSNTLGKNHSDTDPSNKMMDILKMISIGTDTSSTSMDLTPEVSAKDSLVCDINNSHNVAESSGNSRIGMKVFVDKGKASEESMDDEEEDSDEEEEEEASGEDLLAGREPSWRTIVQMMGKFSVMKEMFASGRNLF